MHTWINCLVYQHCVLQSLFWGRTAAIMNIHTAAYLSRVTQKKYTLRHSWGWEKGLSEQIVMQKHGHVYNMRNSVLLQYHLTEYRKKLYLCINVKCIRFWCHWITNAESVNAWVLVKKHGLKPEYGFLHFIMKNGHDTIIKEFSMRQCLELLWLHKHSEEVYWVVTNLYFITHGFKCYMYYN